MLFSELSFLSSSLFVHSKQRKIDIQRKFFFIKFFIYLYYHLQIQTQNLCVKQFPNLKTSLGGLHSLQGNRPLQCHEATRRSKIQYKPVQEIINDFSRYYEPQIANQKQCTHYQPSFFPIRRKILMGRGDFQTCDRRFVRQNTH